METVPGTQTVAVSGTQTAGLNILVRPESSSSLSAGSLLGYEAAGPLLPVLAGRGRRVRRAMATPTVVREGALSLASPISIGWRIWIWCGELWLGEEAAKVARVSWRLRQAAPRPGSGEMAMGWGLGRRRRDGIVRRRESGWTGSGMRPPRLGLDGWVGGCGWSSTVGWVADGRIRSCPTG